MSIILDERQDYLKNKFFTGHQYGDFTPFYIGITICAAFVVFLLILNIVFCWCSPWRNYWRDRHTGNRWIQSLWTTTPHNNPPLDLTELEAGLTTYTKQQESRIQYHHSEYLPGPQEHSHEFMELQKRESDI